MNSLNQENTSRLKKSILFSFSGMVIISIIYIPLFILAENGYFIFHDQFDDAVIWRILNARHAFDGLAYLPELLNGNVAVSHINLVNPFFLTYLVLKPIHAFIFNTYIISIIAFIGMFFLLQKITTKSLLSFLVAITFSILPFYTAYDLTVMGGPLVIYALWSLYEKRQLVLSYILVTFYALTANFVLIGYSLVGFLILITIWLTFRKKLRERKHFVFGFILLFILYILQNISLILQSFLGDGFISHRSEWIIQGVPLSGVWQKFVDTLFYGIYHAAALQIPILYLSVLFLIYGLVRMVFFRPEKALAVQYKLFFLIILSICIFAGISGFVSWEPIAAFRSSANGPFGTFQFDRFIWWYPTLWFLCFGLMVSIMTQEIIVVGNKIPFLRKISRPISAVVPIIVVLVFFHYVWGYSVVGRNTDALLFPDKPATYNTPLNSTLFITWRDYYAEDLYSKIKEKIGKNPNSYKVASIGIHPAVAAFNGLRSIDGYCNNYPLKYKHEFRIIIKKELEKDPSIKAYFDDWGSRCYVFSAEIPKQYFIPKASQKRLTSLEIDTGQIKKLGCSYIISSVPIIDYKALNLEKDGSFVTDDSFFKLYLYIIK